MKLSIASDRTPGRPRWLAPDSQWHLIFYLIAAFDVLTVSISLYLNHRIVVIYRQSVAENQAWVDLLQDASTVGDLAANVNAPGNDVFASRRVGEETGRLLDARKKFDLQLQVVAEKVTQRADPEEADRLHAELAAIQSAGEGMVAEANQLFPHFEQGDLETAGKHMAAMDRRYNEAHQALFRLRNRIFDIQEQRFNRQTAAAIALQRFEYAIAALILLMVGGATLYGQKITEKKRAAEVRSRLLKEVLSTQEEERRRIARDLHDEIGQSLSALLIGLRALEDVPDREAARGLSSDLRRITAGVLDEVRRLAHGLRPGVLDDLGLGPALERLAADFTQVHGLPVQLQNPNLEEQRLPAAIETALYRIVQEALTNVAKHASARSVQIEVRREPSSVGVRIQDDGCGFEVRSPRQDSEGAHLGLSGMRERAALLEGTLTADSNPGAGTRITVSIPLAEEGHGEDSRADRR